MFDVFVGATVPQLQDEFGWLNPKMAQEYISTSRVARRNMHGKLNFTVGAESGDSEAKEEERSMSMNVSKKGKKESGSDRDSRSDGDTIEAELQMDVEERSLTLYDSHPSAMDKQMFLPSWRMTPLWRGRERRGRRGRRERRAGRW